MHHVLVKAQVPVAEQHPVVLELLGMGYEKEQCIEAAELHPQDAAAAQEYLIEIAEKGELFKDSVVDCNIIHGDVAKRFEKPGSTQKESTKLGTCEERYVEIHMVRYMII